MKARSAPLAVASIAAALLCTVALSARQMPPDPPMPGTGLTRQGVVDKLTAPAPGTTISQDRGKAVYEQLCANCHIFGETGNSVGPDLTTLSSRFARKDVLEAIMWPSRVISDQYGVTIFELTDGSVQSGVVVREDERAVYISNAEYLARPLPIAMGRIKARTESAVSLMPEYLVADLTLNDIDSLVSYVRGGK